MTNRNKQCPQCGHMNYSHAKFCGGGCNYRFPGAQSPGVLAVAPQPMPLAPRQDMQMMLPSFDSFNLDRTYNELVQLHNQLYVTQNTLNQGSILWKFKKHIYAAELQDQIKAAFKYTQELWLDAYAQYQGQLTEALHQFQRQQYDHRLQYRDFQFREMLKQEETLNRIRLLARAGDLMELAFVQEGRLGALPGEAQQDFVLNLLDKVNLLIFGCLRNEEMEQQEQNNLDFLEAWR